MLTSWLSSVLNLLTFFRCTTIWLDLVLIAFGVLSGWILGLTITCLSVVAAIFNITVCALERKAKNRTKALPPVKMSVICLDFLFGACYLAAFILELLEIVFYYVGTRERSYYGLDPFGAHVYVGVLVACHYHLFFGSVSLHAWRRQRNGKILQGNNETEIEKGYVMDLGSQVDATTVQPKTSK